MAPNPPSPEEDLQVPDSEEVEDVQVPDSEDYSTVPDSLEEVVEASEEEGKESSEEEEASTEESSEEEEDPTVKPGPTIPIKRPAQNNLDGQEAKRVKEESQPNRNNNREGSNVVPLVKKEGMEGGNVEPLVRKEGMESEREKIQRELKIEQLELIMRFVQLKKDIANFRQKALKLSIPCSDDEGSSSWMRDEQSSSRMRDEWSVSRMRCEWHSLWCDWHRL